jgi:Ca2+-binding EF-hand superfamily protein
MYEAMGSEAELDAQASVAYTLFDIDRDGNISQLEHEAASRFLLPEGLPGIYVTDGDYDAAVRQWSVGLANAHNDSETYEDWAAAIGGNGIDEPGDDGVEDEPMSLAEFMDWPAWTGDMTYDFSPGQYDEWSQMLAQRELSAEVLDRFDGNGDGQIAGPEIRLAFIEAYAEIELIDGPIWEGGRITTEAMFQYGFYGSYPGVETSVPAAGNVTALWPPEVVAHYGLEDTPYAPDEVVWQAVADRAEHDTYDSWRAEIEQPYEAPEEENGEAESIDVRDLFEDSSPEEDTEDEAGAEQLEPMSMEEFFGRAEGLYQGAFGGGFTSQEQYDELYATLPTELLDRYDFNNDGEIGTLELEQALNEARSAASYEEWLNPPPPIAERAPGADDSERDAIDSFFEVNNAEDPLEEVGQDSDGTKDDAGL